MINRNFISLCITLLMFIQLTVLANGEDECFNNLCKLSQPEQKFNPAYLEKYRKFFNIKQPIDSFMNNRNSETYVDLCEEIKTIFKPNFGMSVHNKNLTIVNMKGFEQEITIRKCENTNAACNMIGNGVLPNYNPICVQNYISRMFVVYDSTIPDEEERFSVSEIKYESCCQCSAFDKATM